MSRVRRASPLKQLVIWFAASTSRSISVSIASPSFFGPLLHPISAERSPRLSGEGRFCVSTQKWNRATRKKVVATANRHGGIYNRAGEPSMTFCGKETQRNERVGDLVRETGLESDITPFAFVRNCVKH